MGDRIKSERYRLRIMIEAIDGIYPNYDGSEASEEGGLCPECIRGLVEGRGNFTCICGNVHIFEDTEDGV